MPYDNGKRCTADQAGMTPIPAADLPAMVGKQLHLGWAWVGAVWVLERIEGERIFLRKPTTRGNHIDRIDWARNARYIRKRS